MNSRTSLRFALGALAGFLAALVIAACSVVPDTGRRQFNMLQPGEEAQLGLGEFEKIKKSKPISGDPELNAQVQRVGSRLSQVMPVPNAQWEFVVFEDASPNAFALPGGKVGINTGLFQITQTDEGLATVIGHEVAHVVARHSGERLSQGAAAAGVAAVATELLRKKSEMGAGGTAATAAILGGGATVYLRQFSQDQELEADQLGTLYMARAGYDPREAIGLWQRFAAWRQQSGQGGGGPSFLRTHPVDEVRIANLERFMPRALSEYNG